MRYDFTLMNMNDICKLFAMDMITCLILTHPRFFLVYDICLFQSKIKRKEKCSWLKVNRIQKKKNRERESPLGWKPEKAI